MKFIKRAISLFNSPLILISSCTSSKKLILLQDPQADALNTQNELVKTFILKETEYLDKTRGPIADQYFSMTEERFNFLTTDPK